MISRYLCDALEEMRDYCKVTLKSLGAKERQVNFTLSLIEEVQTYANRMEARLYDYNDIAGAQRKVDELREEKSALKREILRLRQELDDPFIEVIDEDEEE